VVEETVNGAANREYTYGLQRIDEDQIVSNAWTPSFYGYDGFGTVRQLTSLSGAVTDTFEYDAFGNEISSTGTTPNNYLYRGEQFDPDLGLYYLRARYMNPVTGRFVSRDPANGVITNPATLHKYLYASGDPVNRADPSGKDDLIETGELDEELSTAESKEVKEVGEDVACQLETDAATVGLSIPPAGTVLEELAPEGASCTAKVKYGCPEGQTVYRVYGKQSGLWGNSWSPVNPTYSPDWRAVFGIGSWNSGEQLAQGILIEAAGCEAKPAEPYLPENLPGGGLEYFVPNPEYQIIIENITPFVPLFPGP
jgi:RHS repeat-associated protein